MHAIILWPACGIKHIIISHTDVPTFLTTTAEELQQFFDSSCAFGNVHRVLLNHVEDMVERMTKLRSDTRILCKMDQKEDEQRYGM